MKIRKEDNMKVLVLGASGATGRHAVRQLIEREVNVKIIVREKAVIPEDIINSTYIELIKGNVSEFDTAGFSELMKDCEAAISCLGHNLSLKGMFGKPRKLVSDAVRKICEASIAQNTKIKFVLMNTAGFTNRHIGEKDSAPEKIFQALLKALMPPHRDNISAAEYLIKKIGRNSCIEWIAVRPDTLINRETSSDYSLYESPTRSPLFNPGKTSRINVGYFMAELLTDKELWGKWKFRTPNIYNKENS